jgi:creatinine amidohydrolase
VVRQVQLAYQTSPEVGAEAGRGAVALVPTGAVEQHGPHLPVGTDFLIARAIAEEVARSSDAVLVAEPLAYGCSWHHQTFAGTVSLSPRTYCAVVEDVCTSLAASGLRPLLLNGHGGNRAPLQVALANLAAAGVRATAVTYFELLRERARELLPDFETAAGHACALETSIVLHLAPEAVRDNATPAGGTPPTWPDPHMFAAPEAAVVRSFAEINPTGVIGRPELASREIGKQLFEHAVLRCRQIVERTRSGGR